VEACGAELSPDAAELTAGGAEFTTVPAQPTGLSAETPRRLEDTLNPAARAARARAPSAATTMADRPGAMPPAEAPAWVAEHLAAAAEEDLAAAVAEDLTAAVAGAGNPRSLCSGQLCKI